MRRKGVLILLLAAGMAAYSQDGSKMKWWNPAQNEFRVIEGQGWAGELAAPYDRLPARAEQSVRPAVWSLSRNSSGLMIRFRSNAPTIHVRYQVSGPLDMPHMPSTGVSGVDLYAKDENGTWLWTTGRYRFRDTTFYLFEDIRPNDRFHKLGREYRLYLPLYNSVTWMEIGVPDSCLFTPLPVRLEKPIVAYGTSIMQGACASRPGMAWVNILGRAFDRPLINLGFSGNGRLEPELISLMAEIDAKIYILDCLPNLMNPKSVSREELLEKIVASVKQLRGKRPGIPILLIDHSGYPDGSLNPVRKSDFTGANETNHKAFAQLKSEGIGNIYLLTYEMIAPTLDSSTDGTHPSDLGMQQYSDAAEAIMRMILNEPVGQAVTTKPCTQYREPGLYDWEARHELLLQMNAKEPPRTVFIGNSITHYWSGEPSHFQHRGDEAWDKVLKPLGTRNFGFGWDYVQNVLWRIYHDELDGYQAERVILNIGTNNLLSCSEEDILEGMKLIIRAIQVRQPSAEILLLGLYPRREDEGRVRAINLKYAQLAGDMNIHYADPGQLLLKSDGTIDENLFVDGLHPNGAGYLKIVEGLGGALRK